MKYLLLLAAVCFCQWSVVGTTSQGWIIADYKIFLSWHSPIYIGKVNMTMWHYVEFLDYTSDHTVEGGFNPPGPFNPNPLISSAGYEVGPFADKSYYLIWSNGSWDSTAHADSMKNYCIWIASNMNVRLSYVPYYRTGKDTMVIYPSGINRVGPVRGNSHIMDLDALYSFDVDSSAAGTLHRYEWKYGCGGNGEWSGYGPMKYLWIRSDKTERFCYKTPWSGRLLILDQYCDMRYYGPETVTVAAENWVKILGVAAQNESLIALSSGSVCNLPLECGMMVDYKSGVTAEKKQQTRSIPSSAGKIQLFSVDGRRVEQPVASGIMVQVKDGKAIKSVFIRGQ